MKTELDRVKKTLIDNLKIYPKDSFPIYNDVKGRRFTCAEMILELENESKVAEAFLDNIYSAALSVLGLRIERNDRLKQALRENLIEFGLLPTDFSFDFEIAWAVGQMAVEIRRLKEKYESD